MTTLLVVHHTPSPRMQAMLEAVLAGANDDAIEGVDVVVRPALSAGPADVLSADGILLGTPANIGYMSGALKHFFDQIYYPVLEATAGLPYALWVSGDNDTAGAESSVERIATALRWRRMQAPLRVVGMTDADAHDACTELGALAAATLMQ